MSDNESKEVVGPENIMDKIKKIEEYINDPENKSKPLEDRDFKTWEDFENFFDEPIYLSDIIILQKDQKKFIEQVRNEIIQLEQNMTYRNLSFA